MKAVLIIYVCVALLPPITGDLDKVRKRLKKMADQGRIINGIFQPEEDGFLGKGGFSVTYKGTLLEPIKRDVAMKFTPLKHGSMAEREYETYAYLEAINKTDVERYGIPAVYYYGKWDDCILIAITLLDSKLDKIRAKKNLKDVDILILTREFVRISKYIHSRGVYHSDIKLDNFMFRKHQAFIIDFNLAKRLHRQDFGKKIGIPSINVYEDRRRFAKDDWARFLKSICAYIGVKFKLFDNSITCQLLDGYETHLRPKLKDEIEKIDEIENEGFKRVFVEFARNAFKYEIDLWVDKGKCKLTDDQDTTRFPLYDELYRIINEEINKLQLPKPVLVSWLSNEEKLQAKEELENISLPDISSIKDHFKSVDAEYPEVNLSYFAELNGESTISGSCENSKIDRQAGLSSNRSTTSSTAKTRGNISSRTCRGMKLSTKR